MVGGKNEDGLLIDSTEIYNIDSGSSWSDVGNYPNKIYWVEAASIDNTIVCMGKQHLSVFILRKRKFFNV